MWGASTRAAGGRPNSGVNAGELPVRDTVLTPGQFSPSEYTSTKSVSQPWWACSRSAPGGAQTHGAVRVEMRFCDYRATSFFGISTRHLAVRGNIQKEPARVQLK